MLLQKTATLIILSVFTLPNLIQAQCTGTDALGNPASSGLTAEYFAGYFADNTAHVPSTASATNRIEPILNYVTDDWGAIVPPATGTIANPNQFTARYRGSIFIPVDGNYTFYLSSDDASYLWLDNAALDYPLQILSATINNGGAHGLLTRTATVFLTAGWHNLQILYGENFGGNRLIFEYESADAGISRQIVPQTAFCTALQAPIFIPPPPPPPGCTCLDPSANPGQRGIYAEYYANYYADDQAFFNANTPGLLRIDSALAYASNNWGAIVPPASGSAANPERYSARFRGSIFVPVDGNYTFYLTSDDATYFWLGPVAIDLNAPTSNAFVADPGLHAPRTVSASIYLEAGLHPFKIHYGENTGDNRLVLEYESADAGIIRTLVPSAAYCSCQIEALLALRLLRFEANWLKPQVAHVSWAFETLAPGTETRLERSAADLNWQVLHSLNTEEIGQGQFLDNQPLAGWNYYRLSYINEAGQPQYSPIRALWSEGTQQGLAEPLVYPNPAKDNQLFLANLPAEAEVQAKLYSLDTRLVAQQVLGLSRHWQLPDLQPGLYYLHLQAADRHYVLKWQKL